MALVEDQKAVTIAPLFEMDIGGIVDGDGQRLQVEVAAAEQADRHVEGHRQLAVPLVEQVDGRRDDQRRAGGALDGEDREERLAGAGGQDHNAATPLPDPGFQALTLVGERVATDAQRPGRRLEDARPVLVGDAMTPQMLDQSAITAALGPVGAGALVETATRQRRQLFRGRSGDDHGAAVKGEMDGVCHKCRNERRGLSPPSARRG